MRSEANKVKWIKRAVLLMMAMMFLCLQPVQARAEEDEGEYYEEYGGGEIYFRGEYIFENCRAKKTVFYGSQGGTMTLDLANKVITFDNFRDEYYPAEDLDYKLYLHLNFGYSDIDSFTIRLKGKNRIYTDARSVGAIYTDGCSLTVQGPGTLEINSGFDIGYLYTFVIKECKLDITTQTFGVSAAYLEVDNSDIRILRQHTNPQNEMTQRALDVTTLTVNNVKLEIQTEGAGYSNAWIRRNMLNGTEDKLERPLDVMFVRKGGEICVDENNKLLNIYKCYYGNSESDPNRALNYGFSQVEGLDPEREYSRYSLDIAQYVKIVTPGREENLAAVQSLIDKINAIGTVTENSGAAIKAARDAYDALDANFRDRVTNSDTLLKAEKQFEQINQEAAKKVNDLIASLGTITTASKDAIQQAESAYNALTEEQKKYVMNPSAITQAKAAYEKALALKQDSVKTELEKETSKSEVGLNKDNTSASDKKTQSLLKSYNKKSKKVKVTSVKSKKKRTATVKWEKQKNCDGYQIVYSRKKTFKNKKSVYVKGKGKKTYTLKKLKRKKTYYVKMRTYKVINGKKAYGKWSKVHKVKVK